MGRENEDDNSEARRNEVPEEEDLLLRKVLAERSRLARESLEPAQSNDVVREDEEASETECVENEEANSGPTSANAPTTPGAFAVEGAGVDETTTDVNDDEAPIEGAVLVDRSNNEVACSTEDLEEQRTLTNTGLEDSEEVFQGQVLPEASKASKLRLYLVAGSMLLLLTAILIPSVLLTGNDGGPNSSIGSPIEYPPFQEGLTQEVLNGIQVVGSAHYKANQWIWQDPNFDNYTPERRYQRFSMAWLYHLWNSPVVPQHSI